MIEYIVISFAGGVCGAAFGALNAFILCGLASIVGTVLTMATGS